MKRVGVGVWVTIGTLAVSCVVAFVRLEGRVNGHDQAITAQDSRHREIREDLQYIRARLDQVLDGRTAGTTGTSAPLRLAVRPGAFAFAPATIEVRLHAEPGGRGREVLLEVDGPAYYRSSVFNIRPDVDTPTVQPPARYASLPPGAYVVSAVMTDCAPEGCGRRVELARERRDLRILGLGESIEGLP